MYRYLSVLLSKLKTVSLSNFTLPAQHPNYLVPLHRTRPPFCPALFPKSTTLHNPRTIRSTHDLRPYLPSPTHLQPSSSHLTSHNISPFVPKTKHLPESLDGAHLPNPQCLPRSHMQALLHHAIPPSAHHRSKPSKLSSNSNQRYEDEPPPSRARHSFKRRQNSRTDKRGKRTCPQNASTNAMETRRRKTWGNTT
ncbi:uncharacterized protein K444DRAFT_164953 [Hyaloscypha bicolor E]|uniref:Uncharacterized protein n=1 Tax=Hyaloscypha bicolor E TaxID=1095630 RepID=A0A2J6TT02_9HELO|nr:uncharacterized protein K444DRAFT_164953 [Hyaloscypha bicolor E]PMD66159.1 hypothetical protein K444DRAFT_164953 [Hyaloscypha bicolor E]